MKTLDELSIGSEWTPEDIQIIESEIRERFGRITALQPIGQERSSEALEAIFSRDELNEDTAAILHIAADMTGKLREFHILLHALKLLRHHPQLIEMNRTEIERALAIFRYNTEA
jgi:chromosomal replication initiation ATPase DnaA